MKEENGLTIAIIKDNGEINFLGNNYVENTYTPFIADLIIKENKHLKEQKRLILKNINEWIRCSKCEQLESDLIHEKYWNNFEQILRKIFKEYNTENLSDEDFKYKYYLEKENEDMIKELQQKSVKITQLKEQIKQRDNIINYCKFEIKKEKDKFPCSLESEEWLKGRISAFEEILQVEKSDK